MEFVDVDAGWFWMGWKAGHRAERPPHRVWTDAFAIARHPVTNDEYARFLDVAGGAPPPWWTDARFADAAQPVVGVNWFDAEAYCLWLSAESGYTCRLPTEAEWERAARGSLDGARFPWGDERPQAGAFDRPPRVDGTPANSLGLRALSGVCHEWCLDWYDEAYYEISPDVSPTGPAVGERRASRGGAWRHQDPWSAVAHRSSLPPALRYSDYGFRVLRLRGA